MSKLAPLRQSMAALFTPESQHARSAQNKEKTGSVSGSLSTLSLKKGEKSGDALGNPYSPGYEAPPANAPPRSEPTMTDTKGSQEFHVPGSPRSAIRLQAGWEKILLVQKKLCEKAKNLFTALDAPKRYSTAKKSKIDRKSRGCIVDLDIEVLRQEQEEKKRAEKESA